MVREMKHTEIGDIPADWEVQTFEETFRVLSNNTMPRAELNSRGGLVRNVHYGDILTRFTEVLDCNNEDIPFLNDSSSLTASAMPLQDGDVILADTAEDEIVGKATEIAGLGEKKLVSGLHTIPCRVKKGDFTPGWLGYYMNSHVYHDQVLPYVTGIKVSSISKTAIANTIVLIPPKIEQEIIVESFSDIDKLISNLEKKLYKYMNIRTGCLQEMFPQEGELTPQKRLPGFSSAWEKASLDEVLETITDYVAAGSFEDIAKNVIYKKEPDYAQLVRTVDLKHAFSGSDFVYVDKNGFEYLWRVNLNTECIILPNIGANIGEVYYLNPVNLPCQNNVLGPNAIFLKPKDSCLFFYPLLQTKVFRKKLDLIVASSGQPKFNKTELRMIQMSIPEKDERIEIGEFFKDIDHQIVKIKKQLTKYKRLKQGMMSELLTGKIRLV